MKPDYEREGVTLYCGDCLDVLPTFADAPPATCPQCGAPTQQRTGRSRTDATEYAHFVWHPDNLTAPAQTVVIPAKEE